MNLNQLDLMPACHPRLKEVLFFIILSFLAPFSAPAQGADSSAGAGSPVTDDSKKLPVSVRLDEVVDGEHFWGSTNGAEFKGAKVALTVVPDQPVAGESAMKLEGDFTAGGVYVSAEKKLTEFGFADISEIRMRVRAENTESISVRLSDGTGQAHQRKGIPVVPDGQWHELVLKPSEIAGGEHWGGANDGKWRGSPIGLAFILTKPKTEQKKSSVTLAEITAVGTVAAKTGKPVFAADFEEEGGKLEGWKTNGNVKAAGGEAFKGGQSLVLDLSADNLRQKTEAESPAFPVSPGPLEVKLAAKSDLVSQDNSYNGAVSVEYLDAAGKAVGSNLVVEQFRKNGWKLVSKRVDIPANAVAARFVARINKETPGRFWVDEISAAPVAADQKDERINRLMIAASQTGNLLFPEDPRTFMLTVLAARPLPEELRKVSCVVRDYWGAELSAPISVKIERKEKKNGFFVYEGQLDLAPLALEVGRYYEIHGEIPRKDGDPFRNFTSFAILPEAPANKCKAEEVPFTSRNWDNRFPDFVRLTKRIGIRICGGWVGWNVSPPNDPKLVQAELMAEQGLGVLTTTPAMKIEGRGKDWEKWDEKALRQSVRNFIQKYSPSIHPLVINLGNEPHNKGEEVKKDVEAYRILYTEIKSVDPNIVVVGTSVGPEEEYFKAGFGQWCDAYDFHVYETSENVRKALEVDYPALFKKYGYPKPVWSTELGLNSQGMLRQVVAGELYKKFTNFFAGGGANVSWFGFLYPDPAGTEGNSSASAHNVFDCRYNKYAPKLDAVAYYNAVNGIANKKFVGDRVYHENLHAFLFRDQDGGAMQILYKTQGREDVFLLLPGVEEVEAVHIDGRITKLQASGKGVSLTVCEDPLMLLYKDAKGKLPAALGEPEIQLGNAPASLVRGEPSSVDFQHANGTVELAAPPFLKTEKSEAKDDKGQPAARFTVTVPEESVIRSADMVATLKNAGGRAVGEVLYRPAVTGTTTVEMIPAPFGPSTPPGVRLLFHNNSPKPQELAWELTIDGEQAMSNGKFPPLGPTEAFFAEASSGKIKLDGKGSSELAVPLSGIDSRKLYKITTTIRDSAGRVASESRLIGGFVGVPRLTKPLTADGLPDPSEWDRVPAQLIDSADQFFPVLKKLNPTWKGPSDLIASLKFLWDDKCLYLRAEVKDDIAGNLMKDDMLWNQDGLQIMADPYRSSPQKSGKYDYSMGVGLNGPLAWCHLSADPNTPPGAAPDIKVKAERLSDKTADTNYTIAFPWSRLKPFHPAPGANLGMTIALNDDDGNGRDKFMTWFGNVQYKDISQNGDLILEK